MYLVHELLPKLKMITIMLVLVLMMVMDDGDDHEDDRQPVRESSVERNTYPVDEFNLKMSKSQDQ